MGQKLQRVLIVGDDDGIREALAECVGSLGVEVVTARNGDDGLDRARAGARPDAILLDLRIRRLDSSSFFAALRDDATLADIAVVAMTASSDHPALPVRAFLKTPPDLNELAKILRRLGGERPAA